MKRDTKLLFLMGYLSEDCKIKEEDNYKWNNIG